LTTCHLFNPLSSRPTHSPSSATTGAFLAHSRAARKQEPIGAIGPTSKLLRFALYAAAQVPSRERLVFSSLQDVSKWSTGKYKHVYQHEHKARAAEYAAKPMSCGRKTGVFQAGWSLSNYLTNPTAMTQDVSSMRSSILIRNQH
jgi:hypothetical protein